MTARAAGKSDWWIAAALFLGTIVSRVPFRTQLLYAWDSVLYARAIENFDVSSGVPQPPGHLYYVGLVKLVDGLTGDANAAMVWISIAAAAAAVTVLFWLGLKMFGRQAGLIAALLLATSLSFWSSSEVALPYTLLGCLSVSVGGMIYLAWIRGKAWVFAAALALALASGFREDLLPFMLPLLFFAIWNKGRWRVAGAALIVLAGAAAWYTSSALLSGGLAPYRAESSAQSDYLIEYFSVLGRHGIRALGTNLRTLLKYSLHGFSAALVLLPVVVWALVSRRARASLADRRLLFLGIWIAPSFLFYIFIHLGEYGYVFTFLPPALLIGARALQLAAQAIAARWKGAGGPARLAWILALPLVGANMLMFLVLSPPHSANRLAARDDLLHSRIDTIRANFSPSDTFIISVFDYQQVLYYLPEYASWTFDPSVEKKPKTSIPPGDSRTVLFDEYLFPADTGRSGSLPLGMDQTLFYLNNSGSRKVRVDWDSRKVFLEGR